MRSDVSRKRRAKSRGLGHALRAGFSVWLLVKREMSSWNSGIIWLDKGKDKDKDREVYLLKAEERR